MATKTEGKHAAEFLVSEANGTLSRETATVKSGQNLVAGEVVEKDVDGKLIAFSAGVDSDGAVLVEAVGIMWDNVDASATGANADVPGQVYIARLAEVNDGEITYPTETSDGGEKALAIASLEKLHIRPR
ncbi:MAG TPA: head decoration protein [Alphaproteobacteria bacterium]